MRETPGRLYRERGSEKSVAQGFCARRCIASRNPLRLPGELHITDCESVKVERPDSLAASRIECG